MAGSWTERIRDALRPGLSANSTLPMALLPEGDALKTIHAMQAAQYLVKIPTKDDPENPKNDPNIYKCFGNFREHASFLISNSTDPKKRDYTAGLLAARDQKPFVAMLGELHGIFRRKLTKSFSIELDEQALPVRTQTLLSAFRENLKQYDVEMGLMLSKAKEETGNKFVSAEEIRSAPATSLLIEQSASICNALKKSLDEELRTVPLIVNGERIAVANNGHLGGAALAVNVAADHMLNDYKVPEPAQHYLKNRLGGAAAQIPILMRDIVASTPLAERYDAALAAQLPAIAACVTKDAHPLQLMNVLRDREDIALGMDAPGKLLQLAGVAPYPDHLQSQPEFALVLKTIAIRHERSLADAFQNLSTTDLKDDAARAKATAMLDTLPKREGSQYFIYHKALDLARDYVQNADRFATAARQSGESRHHGI